VAGCCEYGDEPSSSGATELVINATRNLVKPSANCAVGLDLRPAVISQFISV
jgi:hypothetical protein